MYRYPSYACMHLQVRTQAQTHPRTHARTHTSRQASCSVITNYIAKAVDCSSIDRFQIGFKVYRLKPLMNAQFTLQHCIIEFSPYINNL